MKKRSKLKISQGKAGGMSTTVKRAKKAKDKLEATKTKKGPYKNFHLRSAMDVRVFLSRIASELYYGEIGHATAGRIGYLLNILLRSIEVGDLTKRLEAIEKLVNDKIQN